jgi:hypothetical protein
VSDLRVKRPEGGFYQDDPEIADAEFAAQAIDEAWYFLKECEPDEQVRGLAGATRGQRLVACAYQYVDFVCNVSGSLREFLESDAGWIAREAADGLQELGFAAEAASLREALAALPEPLPTAPSERIAAWESAEADVGEPLIEGVVEGLARAVEDNRLPTAAAAYIRAHPSDFFLD